MPASATATPGNRFDAIVIGAGIAGLAMLRRLRMLGLSARVYEAGSNVGGTWYWNRYPGARCDVESLEYSFAFSDELQQAWHWPERYGTQGEILKYLNHVADRFDLRSDIRFDTRVTAATFDPKENVWTVRTDRGEVATATYLVAATGNLSTPRIPDIPGLARFRGATYHSGLWPKQGVDFSGQRVGVIGTGSSGIQMIPLIAKQAKHLHVFQRTANFSVPARNAPIPAEVEREHKATYMDRRREALYSPFGMSGYPAPMRGALEDSPEARQAKYEAAWQAGGSIGFLFAYKDLIINQAANDTLADFVRSKIRGIVRDPKVAELLCPNTHPIGAKRLCVDTDYFETYNRDNVTLVDVRAAPIQEITERGVRTARAEYELDAIAFATGFDAMTGALREIDVRVAGGETLANKWAHGPLTYLGLMVAGFPNLFLITGPGSPGVKSQMVVSIEQHVDFIADCIGHLRSRDLDRIEASSTAELAWVNHVAEVGNATLFPLADSWYVGANIPGKPRVFMPYVAGVGTYRRKCDEVVARGYDGFMLSRHGVPSAAGASAQPLAAAPLKAV